MLAADWIRLGEDLPLMGRWGQRVDDLGNRVLAGHIVATWLHRSPPYPKAEAS